MIEWNDIRRKAVDQLVALGLRGEYVRRLKFEFAEIEKQGANTYWTDKFNEGYKYETNKNGLVLPFLLGMTPVDPIGNNSECLVESPDGQEMDAIIITLENGKEIAVSPYTMIMVGGVSKCAKDLKTGDDVDYSPHEGI